MHQTIYKRGYRLVGPVRHNQPQDRTPIRVAIMPFASGHTVPEHLGAAISEEVTARLTAIAPSWVSVLARDSVFTLASRGLTAVQAGEALQADLVLAGTLLSMPTRYRLRVEMIRVQDGTQIWVEDALAPRVELLQLELQIVQRLMFRLVDGNAPAPQAPDNDPSRPAAYEMYLHGHHEWQTGERHRMQAGIEHLTAATELDPTLVAAHVDLAELCTIQELYGFVSPNSAAKQIRHIAESLPDTAICAPGLLPILGWFRFHVDRDLGAALDFFSASAQLPHSPSTSKLRVMFALSRHRFDEAREWLDSALLLDPYAPWLHAQKAWTEHLAGRRTRSVEAIEKALTLFPDDEGTQAYAALILSFNGHPDHGAKLAQDLTRRAPYLDIAAAIHAYALACDGHRDEAHEILERLQWLSRERFVLRSFLPAAFAALGAVDEAVAELQAANDARCPWFFQMLADPRLECIHGHPDFEPMRESLERMELSAAETFEYQT